MKVRAMARNLINVALTSHILTLGNSLRLSLTCCDTPVSCNMHPVVSEVMTNLVREDKECKASSYWALQGYPPRSVSVFSFTSPCKFCIPQMSSCEDTHVQNRALSSYAQDEKLVSQALQGNRHHKGSYTCTLACSLPTSVGLSKFISRILPP